MRGLLVRYGLAVTSLVLIAFLVPLGLLARSLAGQWAIEAGRADAQSVAAFTGSTGDDPARLEAALLAVNAGPRRTTVYRPDGTLLGAPAPVTEGVRLAFTGRALTARTPEGAEVLVPVGGVDGVTVVRTFVPEAELMRGVARSWWILVGVGVVILLATALIGDGLARRLTRSVRALASVAERLGAGDLTARVEPSGPPELVAVGGVLNRLGERVTDLLAEERELVADLSHRLRTPITALRLDVEMLADPVERAQIAGHVDDLVAGLDAIVRTARTPLAGRAVTVTDAGEVVRQRAGFWGVLAADQHRPIRVDVPPGPAPVRLAGDELGAALDALVDNVFSHTPPGTGFGLGVHVDGSIALVTVDDDGPGLPGWSGLPADAPQPQTGPPRPVSSTAQDIIARGRSGAGSTGLGLDVARRAVERAGGSVDVGASATGGVRVTLRLPLVTGAP